MVTDASTVGHTGTERHVSHVTRRTASSHRKSASCRPRPLKSVVTTETTSKNASMARRDDQPGSDVDFFVDVDVEPGRTLLDVIAPGEDLRVPELPSAAANQTCATAVTRPHTPAIARACAVGRGVKARWHDCAT
jgi:hypothetical protein